MADERPTEEEVDAATQAACEAQAAALGVSVDEYLNDLLLQTMLRQQVVTEPAEDLADEDALPTAGAEAQLARQRLESIDRRLTVAAGNFESTVETVDRALAALSARADDHEARHERLGARIEAALEALRESADLLQGRATGAEQGLAALAEAHDAAQDEVRAQYETLVQRLATKLDEYADDADAARDAAHAQSAEFEAAVRAEFGRITRTVEDWRVQLQADVEAAFSQERAAREATDTRLDDTRQALAKAQTAIESDLRIVEARAEQRLNEHSAETRAALEATSHRAERLAEEVQRNAVAAAQRSAAEARASCEALEGRLIETTADVNGRIDAVRAETARYYEGLAEKLGDSERATQARIADVCAQADAAAETLSSELAGAREAIAHLRQGQHAANARMSESAANADAVTAALSAEIEQAREALADTQVALTALVQESDARHSAMRGSVDAKIDAEIVDMRERHMGAVARVQVFETNLAQMAGELSALASQVEDGQQTAAVQLAETVEALRAAATRQGEAVEAEVARLRGDLSGAESRASEMLAAISARAGEEVAAVRELLTRELGDLRSSQKGALARLDAAEQALAEVRTAEGGAAETLREVNARLERTETEFAALASTLRDGVTRLHGRAEATEAQLAAHASAVARIDEIATRLNHYDMDAGDLAERTGNLGRLVNKLSAQYAEATTGMQERLHKLEVGLADARLERMQPGSESYTALEERLNTIERRSLSALHQLTQTIATLSKRGAAQPAEDDKLRSA